MFTSFSDEIFYCNAETNLVTDELLSQLTIGLFDTSEGDETFIFPLVPEKEDGTFCSELKELAAALIAYVKTGKIADLKIGSDISESNLIQSAGGTPTIVQRFY